MPSVANGGWTGMGVKERGSSTRPKGRSQTKRCSTRSWRQSASSPWQRLQGLYNLIISLPIYITTILPSYFWSDTSEPRGVRYIDKVMLIIDRSTHFGNIDKVTCENIDINMVIFENIYVYIDKRIFWNIDIINSKMAFNRTTGRSVNL